MALLFPIEHGSEHNCIGDAVHGMPDLGARRLRNQYKALSAWSGVVPDGTTVEEIANHNATRTA